MVDLENFRLSKSKILTYLNCPRQFKYAYIDKEPRPEPEEDSPLRIGLDVHSMFEMYYNDPKAAELEPPYESAMFSILHKYPGYYKYINFIENFVDFNMTLIKESGVPGYLPKATELKLFDKDLNFVGIIDCVFETPSGIVILDFKTGKPKPITEYRIELLLYSILYSKQTGEDVDYVGIFFPRTGTIRMAKIVKPTENPPEKGAFFTIDEEFEALSTIDEIRRRISMEHFVPSPSFLCNFCDYEDLCKKDGLINL